MKKPIWLMTMVVMLVITGCVNGNKRSGVEYYVDTESRGGPADDNNPGIKNKPWKTIARAVSDKQPCPGPGDTIFIRGGSYRETVVLTRGGSANQPLVLKSYGKEKPVIDGEKKRTYGITLPATGRADYVEITGITITNAAMDGVSVSRRNHVVLRQLDISGAGRDGINFSSSSNIVIEKSQIHHIKGSRFCHGIAGPEGNRTITISDNDIYEIGDPKSVLSGWNISVWDTSDVVISSKPKIENVEVIGPDTARLVITNVDLRTLKMCGRNAKPLSGISTNSLTAEDQAMVQRRPNLALLFPPAPEPKYDAYWPSPCGKPLPGGAERLRDGRDWFYLRNNPEWDNKPFSPDGRQCLIETGNAASNDLAKAKYVYFAQTFDEALHCGDIRIINNRLSGSSYGIGILTHGSGFLIKDNYIQHAENTAIQIESGVKNLWIEGNVCIANSTGPVGGAEGGIWVDENADIVMQNNIVTENQFGFNLSQCRYILVRRNLIINNRGQHLDPSTLATNPERHASGIILSGGRHGHLGDVPGLSACAVVHNTFYGNGVTNAHYGTIRFGLYGVPFPPPISVSNVFLNNILVENNPKCVFFGFDFPIVMDGNLYHHASGVFSVSTSDALSGKKYSAFITNQNDFARYQQETGKDVHSHIGRAVFADPGKNEAPRGSLLRHSSSGYEGREPRGIFAKFSEAPTLLRQGFGGFSSPSSPGYSAKENNFRLTDKSPGIDQGQPLTRTTQTGSGKRLPVENVWCFSAGYKTPDESIVIPGDDIMIAGTKARVMAVDRETSSLILAADLSWNKDDPVSYAYIGAGPDIGAVESK